MKYQALFSSKDKSNKLKCRLLQFLFGTLLGLRVGTTSDNIGVSVFRVRMLIPSNTRKKKKERRKPAILQARNAVIA